MTRLIDIVSADVMAFLEHNDELLNMDEGPHSRAKHWANPESTCAKSHPDFDESTESSGTTARLTE